MPRFRPVRAVLAAGLLAAAAVGCGDAGELESAGATPTATSPARLWPDLAPASSPAWNYDDGRSEVMRGVTVPGGDIRRVDPVAVVRAEIRQHPNAYTSPKAAYRETARRTADCGDGAGHGRCPVLTPYYRDLTGDGREELTLGFRLLPGDQTAVRVYTVASGQLVQVMSNDDAISSVELAGRSVIIHAPSDISDYEYRFQWTWDPDQHLMLLTHDEMIRIGREGHTASPPPRRPAPPPSPPSPPSPPFSAPSSPSSPSSSSSSASSSSSSASGRFASAR
ncbi:hypothetical protein ABZ439_24650 [Streptomyces sp. NPDC005840]|uniref:hypothetical protein n=1 Tax=Streptomyces sp. NPDC005840 TaxID=3157072 RepID=UPI0033E61C81